MDEERMEDAKQKRIREECICTWQEENRKERNCASYKEKKNEREAVKKRSAGVRNRGRERDAK